MTTTNGRKRASFDLDVGTDTESESPTPNYEKQAFFDDAGVDFPSPSPAQDIYEATLPWWRAAVRRWIVRRVEKETKVIARMQVCFIRASFIEAGSLT